MATVTIRALVVFAFLSLSCSSPAATAGTPTATPRAAVATATPAPTPATDPAGTVVAVKGAVQATTIAGVSRTLAQGDGVWPDETVKTPKDATVDIRLRHNGVVWSMRGGLQKRVDQSLAWTAPKASTTNVLFATVADASRVSAGRHSENEAAHSGESLIAPSRTVAPGGASGGGAGASGKFDASSAKDDEMDRRVVSPAPPPPPVPLGQAASSGEDAGAPVSAKASSADSVPPTTEVEATKSSGEKKAAGPKTPDPVRPMEEKPKAKATSGMSNALDKDDARPGKWTITDHGKRKAKDLEKTLAKIPLGACSSNVVLLRFTLEIGEDGRVGELVLLDAGGSGEADFVCVEAMLRATEFSRGAASVVSVRYAR